MIEVVWKEADSDQLTRYKVLYPINVQEKRFPHGYKGFSLQVPFSDSVVLKSVCLRTSPKSLSSAFYSLVPAPLPVLKP